MTTPTLARDAFGLQPLYRHQTTGATGASLHDFLPADADVESLVEYLAFGELWRDRTFLKDVRREPSVRSAQSPADPIDGPGHEIVAEFWDVFRDAVERAVGGRRDIVVSLSGGLDSAAMAVAAVELYGASRVRAVTMGFARDFDDPEPRLARETASMVGIDCDVVWADSTALAVGWEDSPVWPTEPAAASRVAWDARMPGADGVILWGLGGDSLLRGDRDHYASRLRRGQWRGALGDLWQTVVLRGRRPGFGLQRRLRKSPGGTLARPDWLGSDAPGFEAAAELRATLPATWRTGVDELNAPVWAYYFETEAPQNTLREHRYVYPFFDLALADYVGALPTAPWCIDKEVLRAALRGKVPESVRLRPKTPTAGEPMVSLPVDGADACRAAIESGAADALFDRAFALDALSPGIHRWSDMAPVMRCCAVARWLAR